MVIMGMKPVNVYFDGDKIERLLSTPDKEDLDV